MYVFFWCLFETFNCQSEIVLGYSLITDHGICDHIDGRSPTGCGKGGMSENNCKGFCSSHNSCVGYTYQSIGKYCLLHFSNNICPLGFRLANSYRSTAKTMEDLVATPINAKWHSVCYGKILTN